MGRAEGLVELRTYYIYLQRGRKNWIGKKIGNSEREDNIVYAARQEMGATKLASCLLLTAVSSGQSYDKLWLRYTKVVGSSIPPITTFSLSSTSNDHPTQLEAIRDELTLGLGGITDKEVVEVDEGGDLVVEIGRCDDCGEEGYKLSTDNGFTISANTSSGALYGTFDFLGLLQQNRPVVNRLEKPTTKLRMWNLWDALDGQGSRMYAGDSILWPMALYDDEHPPPRDQVYVSKCDTSNAYQHWSGDTLNGGSDLGGSTLVNEGEGRCLLSTDSDPMKVGDCEGEVAAKWYYNATNSTIALQKKSSPDSARDAGSCLDLNGGFGPDIDLYPCHGSDNVDYLHQMWSYDGDQKTIHPVVDGQSNDELCLSAENISPSNRDGVDPWEDGNYKKRIADYLRLIKSSGMNAMSLQDVNACGVGMESLESDNIQNITKNLYPIFEKYAITPFYSLCFGAPSEMGEGVSGDPLDPATVDWWTAKMGEVYDGLPNLGGVLIKADSEGNVGPASFNRTQAEGSNMLAKIMDKYGGLVIWRAFVYGGDIGDEDLARQATETFVPLDGQFDHNVIIQIKNGPYDFQIREPLQPLIGALKNTNIMMEVQATQEYTGQQIHAVSLVKMWEHYLAFDTLWEDDGSTTVGKLISGVESGGKSLWGGGMACVSNFGNMGNWTGNIVGGSNTYGFGKLAWNPVERKSDDIIKDWAAMTFESGVESDLVEKMTELVQNSWNNYEHYWSPLGIGFIIGQNNTYGCAPKTDGPGLGPGGEECAPIAQHGGGRGAGNDHYWADPCPNYDFANYSDYGIGCDRTVGGTGSQMIELYSPGVQAIYNNVSTIDRELLLFFHNLPWDHLMQKEGGEEGQKVTLLEFIDARSKKAIDDLRDTIDRFNTFKGIDETRFEEMKARFEQQFVDATAFRENIIDYYHQLAEGA